MDSQFPHWLPEMVQPDKYETFSDFINDVYLCYLNDFVRSTPRFHNCNVGVKRFPPTNGMDRAFFHLTTAGDFVSDNESERQIDIERCKRIRWPRSIIDNAEKHGIWIWENSRRNRTRTLLWLHGAEYIVILEKRKSYYLLWTAYCTDRSHTKRKLQREYLAYKAKAAD